MITPDLQNLPDHSPLLVTPARILRTLAVAKNLGLKPVHWRIGRDVKAHWMSQERTIETPNRPDGTPMRWKEFTMGGIPCETDFRLEPNQVMLVTEREIPLLPEL